MSHALALPTYTAIYAFGDRLSDAGPRSPAAAAAGAIPASPPHCQAQYRLVSASVFSDGPAWAQNLSLDLGRAGLAPSRLGGTDDAHGGAEPGPTPRNGSEIDRQTLSFRSQIARVEAAARRLPGALHTVWLGSGDLPDFPGEARFTAQRETADATDAVSNEIAGIVQLARDGARNLMLVDIPDLAKTEDATEGSQPAGERNGALDAQATGIAGADHLDPSMLDAYQMIDSAVAGPSAHGLANVVSDQRPFCEALRPTEAGHQVIAAAAEEALAAAPCYAAGTLVRTPAGEVPVERLRAGQLVCTLRGLAPVRGIGHRLVDCRRCPRPQEVWPVRVAADAFGAGLPQRDLVLSPNHAVFIGGALIPIRYLVNGRTVAREPCAFVDGWRVEFARHEVMFAEGLPAESCFDTGNRATFAGSPRAETSPPAHAPRICAAKGRAALVRDGPRLSAARHFLLSQAEALGHVRTSDPALRIVAGGRNLRPRLAGRRRGVRLPDSARDARLVSRGSAPAELRDDSFDHRRLGVAVSAIFYVGERIALTDRRLGLGWHDVEWEAGAPAWRWTNGNAALDLPGGDLLELELAMTGLHWGRRETRRVGVVTGERVATTAAL